MQSPDTTSDRIESGRREGGLGRGGHGLTVRPGRITRVGSQDGFVRSVLLSLFDICVFVVFSNVFIDSFLSQ